MSSEIYNEYQITRQDGTGCFVEVKSDLFHKGKVHFQFKKYDPSNGNKTIFDIHYYLDMDEFLHFADIVVSGKLQATMEANKKAGTWKTLLSWLAGTPKERLKTPRTDGMAQSRSMELIVGGKIDYMLSAKTGPGESDAKGLIVPRYKKPEKSISIAMDTTALRRMMLITNQHIQAWLTIKYTAWKAPDYYKENES